MPPITEKDQGDALVGIEEGVDLFALSFVREENDIRILRGFLDENGGHDARIIAKIEDQSAITNLEGIIGESDGLMVARGDLGIECPFETLPIIQHNAVKSCLRLGKPVIIATHMLESMISNPIPTRAEVSDVAIAIEEEADCVMLSGETTIGKYPIQCVEALTKISKAIDQDGKKFNFAQELSLTTDKARIQHSAVIMANELMRLRFYVSREAVPWLVEYPLNDHEPLRYSRLPIQSIRFENYASITVLYPFR